MNSSRTIFGNRSAPTAVWPSHASPGNASSNFAITVSGVAATRIDTLFHRPISANNSTVPQYLQAAVSDGSSTQTRHCWLSTATGTTGYSVDGNLTSDSNISDGGTITPNGQWTYVWDAENRLVAMETTFAAVTAGRPFRKLAFAYDWTGRRLSRTVTDTNNAVLSATRWLYDAWNPIAEYSLHTSSLILHTSYLWGMDMSGTLQGAGGVGGLLAVGQFDIQNSTFVIFHPSLDGNGNITAWTQSGSTTPVCRREYDAFGNIVVEQGTPPGAIGFSTKIEDPETGLLYYGHRYYCPPLGRWISQDPIEEEGGLNLYGYIRNNSVNRWDVLGLDTIGPEIKRDWIERLKTAATMPLIGDIINKIYNDVYVYTDNDNYIVEGKGHEIGVAAHLDLKYEEICRRKHTKKDGSIETIRVDPGEAVTLKLRADYSGNMLERVNTADFWLGTTNPHAISLGGQFDCRCSQDIRTENYLHLGDVIISKRRVQWDWKDEIDTNLKGARTQDWQQIVGESLVAYIEVFRVIEFKVSVHFTDGRK